MVGTERAPRARGECKRESEYYFLPPGEQPPHELPFPEQGEPCPHCEKTGHMVWRPTFCHCHYCGFVKEMPVEAMPITPELRRAFRQKEMEVVHCTVCDKRFERMAFYDSDLKDLCPVCRNRERSKQYKRQRLSSRRSGQIGSAVTSENGEVSKERGLFNSGELVNQAG